MHLRKTHIATLVVGLALVLGVAFTSFRKPAETTISADAPVGTARLTLDPAKASAKVGDEVSFQVKLDTNEDPSVGIDLLVKYDPSLLEPVDADGQAAGVQIKPGTGYDFVAVNTVTTAKGLINYSAAQQPTSDPVEVAGTTVATLTFKTKAAGRAAINFVSQPGNSRDTNVAAVGGRDLLNQVSGAVLTISQ